VCGTDRSPVPSDDSPAGIDRSPPPSPPHRAPALLRLWKQIGPAVCSAAVVVLAVTYPSVLTLPLLAVGVALLLAPWPTQGIAAAGTLYLALVTLAQYGAAIPLQFQVGGIPREFSPSPSHAHTDRRVRMEPVAGAGAACAADAGCVSASGRCACSARVLCGNRLPQYACVFPADPC
jgi:hypothetical protein